jgi:SAM-dependent methyltransferase
VVINVESSHCYPHIDRFFAEVVRVLKPGGHFLYADFREAKAEAAWRQQLLQTGLRWLTEADITGQVVTALELDDARKGGLISQKIPKFLHMPFNEFAAMKGSRLFYGAFQSREKIYRSFMLQKS